MDSSTRPPLQFVISKKTWQVTSLRAMVGMSPQCTLVMAGEPTPAICGHAETRVEEESHFAPTGKGTITMRVICKACQLELVSNTEYYD
jgi:hypothetical protein